MVGELIGHRVELTVVLDRTQGLDEPALRDELETARRKGLVLRVGRRIGLEADPAGKPLGEVGEEVALRLDELGVLDGAARCGVAEVAEQAGAVRLDEQRGVRARETDEVADVRAVRDEERLLERPPQALQSRAHWRRSARNGKNCLARCGG